MTRRDRGVTAATWVMGLARLERGQLESAALLREGLMKVLEDGLYSDGGRVFWRQIATYERRRTPLDRRARAEEALTASLTCGPGGNMVWLAAATLEGMAGVAVGKGQVERAVRLYGAADALRSRIGTPVMPVYRPLYDRYLAAVRAALDTERCEALWGEGRAMALEQAISYALAEE